MGCATVGCCEQKIKPLARLVCLHGDPALAVVWKEVHECDGYFSCLSSPGQNMTDHVLNLTLANTDVMTGKPSPLSSMTEFC